MSNQQPTQTTSDDTPEEWLSKTFSKTCPKS